MTWQRPLSLTSGGTGSSGRSRPFRVALFASLAVSSAPARQAAAAPRPAARRAATGAREAALNAILRA